MIQLSETSRLFQKELNHQEFQVPKMEALTHFFAVYKAYVREFSHPQK